MASLLEGGLAKVIAGATSSLMYDVTLRVVSQAETGEAWVPGSETITDHTVRGFVWDYKDFQKTGTIIEQGDRKITILADGLTVVPKPGMQVVAQGTTYAIINVEKDPAGATYTLQVRP